VLDDWLFVPSETLFSFESSSSASPAAIRAMKPIRGVSRNDNNPHLNLLRPLSPAAHPTKAERPTHVKSMTIPMSEKQSEKRIFMFYDYGYSKLKKKSCLAKLE
jgi:hypothetical protein